MELLAFFLDKNVFWLFKGNMQLHALYEKYQLAEILQSRRTKTLKEMKTTMKLLLALSISLLVACNQTKKEEDTQAKNMKEEVQDVVDASKDYASEKLNTLNTEINQLKDSLNVKIEEVRKKYDAQNEELKAKLKMRKEEIEKLRVELEDKITEYNQVVQDKKGEVKEEIDRIKTALEKSIEAFNKEMDEKNKKTIDEDA